MWKYGILSNFISAKQYIYKKKTSAFELPNRRGKRSSDLYDIRP